MSDVISVAVAALGAKMAGGFTAGVAKFVIPGEGAIMVDGAGVRAGDEEADVTLTAATEVFEMILAGDLSAASAFMSGKRTARNNISAARK